MQILEATPQTLAQLVQKHDLMQSIEDVIVNVGGQQVFDSHYLPVLERFADRAQSVPLQKAAFSYLGGAFCCGVRAATLAVRACDATIFSPTSSAAERLTNDGQYRWLAYCAALATVYLIASASVDVVSGEGDQTYRWSNDIHLIDWLSPHKMAWVERPQYLLSKLHPHLSPLFFPGQFAHLPRALVADFASAINPSLATSSAEVALARVVRQSIDRVIADEKSMIAGWVSQETNEHSSIPSAPSAVLDESPVSSSNKNDAPTQENLPSKIPLGRPLQEHQIDEATGEIVTPAAPISPQETSAQIKAREWLTALGSLADMDEHVTEISGGRIHIERKAMGFGALPTVNARMLYDAGLIDRKLEKTVETTPAATVIYLAAKTARASNSKA